MKTTQSKLKTLAFSDPGAEMQIYIRILIHSVFECYKSRSIPFNMCLN